MRLVILKPNRISLMILMSLGLVVCLSGCIQQQEPPSFNPEQAIFYDPTTNKSGYLSVTNLNGSRYSFQHLDQIEILVGLRDSQEIPGVNYTLILMLKYSHFGEPEELDLTDQLPLQYITNDSGLVRSKLTYNQFTWPRGISLGEGQFKISCSSLPNVTAESDKFTLNYYDSTVIRNTTVEGGLEAIDLLEQYNLIEEALSLNGSENTFNNWDFRFSDFRYVIINASSIDYFFTLQEAHDIEFLYHAWVSNLEAINLTYSHLNAICTDLWGEWFPHLGDYLSDDWLLTGPLSQINISTGWVILQYLRYNQFSHEYSASLLKTYQIALLDTDFHLKWLISSTYQDVA